MNKYILPCLAVVLGSSLLVGCKNKKEEKAPAVEMKKEDMSDDMKKEDVPAEMKKEDKEAEKALKELEKKIEEEDKDKKDK